MLGTVVASGMALRSVMHPDSFLYLFYNKRPVGFDRKTCLLYTSFMRQGYFCVDKDSTPGNLIINRTVALNSSWDKKKK